MVAMSASGVCIGWEVAPVVDGAAVVVGAAVVAGDAVVVGAAVVDGAAVAVGSAVVDGPPSGPTRRPMYWVPVPEPYFRRVRVQHRSVAKKKSRRRLARSWGFKSMRAFAKVCGDSNAVMLMAFGSRP